MEENNTIVHCGLSFNGLLTVIGIILCIICGTGTVPGLTWVLACIPFMIIGAEFAIVFIIAMFGALCSLFIGD